MTKLIDRHGNLAMKAWANLSPSHEESDLSRDIFCLLNSWGNPIATFHNVEFSRIDVAKLVSRSGVGGAPFKKIHWQKMTATLLELAFAEDGRGFDRFDSYSEFLSYLECEINGAGDALDRSSINCEARRYWDRYGHIRPESTNP